MNQHANRTRVSKRKFLVYFVLLVSVVFVPFSVPSFDGSTTQTVGSQSVPTFPALPSRLDFGSWQPNLPSNS